MNYLQNGIYIPIKNIEFEIIYFLMHIIIF